MSNYIFEHEGQQFTPDGTVSVPDTQAHNEAVTAEDVTYWQGKPDRMLGYYSFPAERTSSQRQYRSTFCPRLTGAQVTTWTGITLGVITSARVYQHNFGSRMVAVTVTGTNGANYYGRASYDWGSCIMLRRFKG